MTIISFACKDSQELAQGIDNKRTRRLLPKQLHRSALIKMHILRAASQLDDLLQYPGLGLEQLKGNRKSEYSIRINKQYRICFKWRNGEACYVMVEDYH